MRRFLTVIPFLLISSILSAQTITRVAGNTSGALATATGGNLSTSSFNVSTGNYILCSSRYASTDVPPNSVSDTGSANTFSQVPGAQAFDGSTVTVVWKAYPAVAVSGDVVTFHYPSAVGFAAIWCDVYSGFTGPGSHVDQVKVVGNSSTGVGPFTTTVANEFIFAGLSANSTGGNLVAGSCGTVSCVLQTGSFSGNGAAAGSEGAQVAVIQTAQTVTVTTGTSNPDYVLVTLCVAACPGTPGLGSPYFPQFK
jgi:hypothetical protein